MLYRGLSYTLLNFATPIVFYFAFRYLGAKAAIGYAILATFLQFLAHRLGGKSLSPFFLLSSGFVIFFGSIDLILRTPTVFRLEPFVQNFVVATSILITTMADIPLFEYFVDALPHWLRPVLDPEMAVYLRRVTWVWIGYLYVKSAVFLYLAFHVDLGTLILLRSVLGGGSLLLLILGEFAYRSYFWQRASQKKKTA